MYNVKKITSRNIRNDITFKYNINLIILILTRYQFNLFYT